jgi:uncharacterized protein YggU (UPF0235/DUF167 family)
MTLSVRVTPGAKHDSLEQTPDGTWKIRLRARAVEGAANAALVEQLAEWLDVPKSHIRLVRGQSARQKVLAIDSLDEAETTARLRAATTI